MRRLILAVAFLTGLWTHSVWAQATLRSPIHPVPAAAISPRGSPVLYEIRIPKINGVTVKAYDAESNIFVPLKSVLDLAGFACQIDSTRRQARFNKRTLALNPATTFWDENTLYLSLSTLTSALGINALVDRTEAAIVFENVEELPVVRRAARDAARAALLKARAMAAAPAAPLVKPSSSMGSLLFDYMLFQQYTGNTTHRSFSLATATKLGPGTVAARLSRFGRSTSEELSWFGVWPDSRELKQLRLGYGPSSAPGGFPIRGIYLTNAPLVRPNQFSILELTGSLPPEWSVEAYRNGVLIGFDTIGTSGRFWLDVPVQYGENPVDLVAYGPSGEIVRFGRMIRTRSSMLPPGEFEFAASTGACVMISCQWMMNLDFRYGLSSRWSVRGGATEYTWSDGQPVNVYPYVSLDGIVGAGLALNAEFMRRGYSQVGLSWDPARSVTVVGNYTNYASGEAGTQYANTTRDQLWLFARVFIPHSRVALETQATRISGLTGQHSFMRSGASVTLNNATLRPYLRVSEGTQTRMVTSGIDAVVSGDAFPFNALRRWILRGAFEADTYGSLRYAEAMLSRSGLWGVSGEAGIRWYPGSRPYLAVSFATDMGQIRTQTNTVGSLSGSLVSVQQAMSGSLRWDADTRQLLRSADPLLDRAGIAGVVYLDANNNGVFDEGDRPIANASVKIGQTTTFTNARGYYELWGIAPGQIILVALDASTLESPWWIPARPATRVATAPNRSVPLNIPVLTGGIVEGAIVADGVVPNLPITMTHRETGRQYTITPFTDGSFYQMGLLPGLYDARISRKVLADHHAVSEPMLVYITPGATNQTDIFVAKIR